MRQSPGQPLRGSGAGEEERCEQHQDGRAESHEEATEHEGCDVGRDGEQSDAGRHHGRAGPQQRFRCLTQQPAPGAGDRDLPSAEPRGEPSEPRLVDVEVPGREQDDAAEGGHGEADRRWAT